MAKKKNNLLAKAEHETRAKFKKTSIAKRRPKLTSMNKSKKRSFKNDWVTFPGSRPQKTETGMTWTSCLSLSLLGLFRS